MKLTFLSLALFLLSLVSLPAFAQDDEEPSMVIVIDCKCGCGDQYGKIHAPGCQVDHATEYSSSGNYNSGSNSNLPNLPSGPKSSGSFQVDVQFVEEPFSNMHGWANEIMARRVRKAREKAYKKQLAAQQAQQAKIAEEHRFEILRNDPGYIENQKIALALLNQELIQLFPNLTPEEREALGQKGPRLRKEISTYPVEAQKFFATYPGALDQEMPGSETFIEGPNCEPEIEEELANLNSSEGISSMLSDASLKDDKLAVFTLGYIKSHSKNFSSKANIKDMLYLPAVKTVLLVFLNNEIFVTSGARSKDHPDEIKKAHPERAPHVTKKAADTLAGSKDGKYTKWNDPVNFPNYDRAKTQIIVDTILRIDPKATILFNDPKIKGVKPYPKHDDHIHITWSMNQIEESAYNDKFSCKK